MSEGESSETGEAQMKRIKTASIQTDQIRPGPYQCRIDFNSDRLAELAGSIAEHGLIYPVLVTDREEENVGDGFYLLSGERRWRAAKIAGLEEIPATLVEGSPAELHELSVLDNLQREQLSPVEEGHAFARLMEAYGYSVTEVAVKLRKSPGYIADRLRLLDLSEEAGALANSQEIPQRTLRDVAGLPSEVQAAALSYLQEGPNWDRLPTTRQATNICKALMAFLSPEHWTIPLDEVITPSKRNIIKLIGALVAKADLKDCGPRLLRLRKLSDYGPNTLAGAPLTMRDPEYQLILHALTGRVWSVDEAWRRLTNLEDWCCLACRFGELTPEECEVKEPAGVMFYCPRPLDVQGKACRGYIGPGDPVVIPVGRWEDEDAFRAAAGDGELKQAPGVGFYATDVKLYAGLYQGACKAKPRLARARAKKGRAQHIAPLQQYAQMLLEDPRLASSHPMAHHCQKCARACDKQDGYDLCGYLEKPLKATYTNASEAQTRAPKFGLLVSSDGEMIPRCEFFHYRPKAEPPTPRATGFRLPDPAVALGWIDQICKFPGVVDHSATLPGVLAWLPYSRPRDKSWDRKKMLSYLRRSWDRYGDEGIAWLIGAALQESRMRTVQRRGRKITLPNPVSGLLEDWASVSWRVFVRGEAMY